MLLRNSSYKGPIEGKPKSLDPSSKQLITPHARGMPNTHQRCWLAPNGWRSQLEVIQGVLQPQRNTNKERLRIKSTEDKDKGSNYQYIVSPMHSMRLPYMPIKPDPPGTTPGRFSAVRTGSAKQVVSRSYCWIGITGPDRFAWEFVSAAAEDAGTR